MKDTATKNINKTICRRTVTNTSDNKRQENTNPYRRGYCVWHKKKSSVLLVKKYCTSKVFFSLSLSSYLDYCKLQIQLFSFL